MPDRCYTSLLVAGAAAADFEAVEPMEPSFASFVVVLAVVHDIVVVVVVVLHCTLVVVVVAAAGDFLDESPGRRSSALVLVLVVMVVVVVVVADTLDLLNHLDRSDDIDRFRNCRRRSSFADFVAVDVAAGAVGVMVVHLAVAG